MAISRVDICNMALAELPETRIDALDDGSFAAETCQTAYQPALEFLLEDHAYDFAIERDALALVTNTRTDEWGYAYALPTSMATPRFVLPSPDLANIVDVVTTPTQGFYGQLRSYENAVQFRIAGGVLYTSIPAAVLEFISNNPSESRFTAKFARALALELASRIVMPIKKDNKRQGELIQMAEVARERAKAEDMNRDPDSAYDFISEVQIARMGWGSPFYSGPVSGGRY